ncbi:hypothetical protein FIBSPDRAFT_55357 [Athelia psychrophila]|uniref:Uncharacterized protein n=1 Tax=Athelia psychrophila TaxID=1759441 RepID=A0A166FF07_9AGAM|nr:hypothetical protein FIBSPDRAFT_55357 [Fibularhizoctonia sp. CBS 109695]
MWSPPPLYSTGSVRPGRWTRPNGGQKRRLATDPSQNGKFYANEVPSESLGNLCIGKCLSTVTSTSLSADRDLIRICSHRPHCTVQGQSGLNVEHGQLVAKSVALRLIPARMANFTPTKFHRNRWVLCALGSAKTMMSDSVNCKRCRRFHDPRHWQRSKLLVPCSVFIERTLPPIRCYPARHRGLLTQMGGIAYIANVNWRSGIDVFSGPQRQVAKQLRPSYHGLHGLPFN